MKFTELALHEEVQRGVDNAGYEVCTPVQEQVLLHTKKGTDLYVQSQTGTGKTAAYLIAVFEQMLTKAESAGKKALVMAPTRELAVQIEEEAKTLLKHTKLFAASFYGGVGYEKQKEFLKKGVDVIIGTPGRIIDLQESGFMDLSEVGFLVVDEADRMFDMGFYPDLRTLIKVLPEASKRQTMLFSATLNTYVKNLAWEYTEDAEEITIEAENITVNEIDQQLIHVSSDEKMSLLLGILAKENAESSIIFCNTKRMTEVVAKRLTLNGIKTEFIIGDLPQSKRLSVMKQFKEGKLACLTATDVAARGIDVDDLQLVVNYDLPNESENYVHRIGRTARAGRSGRAYTFCSEQDVYNLPSIEKYIEMTIPSIVASEDMFVEDKSKDIYIKTGRYEEEDGRDRRGGRPGNRNDGRSDNRRGRGEHGYSRDGKHSRNSAQGTRGDNRDRNRGTKDGFKSGKARHSVASYGKSENRQDLSNLSFEERMKVYKEKYASSSETPRKSGKPYGERSQKTGKGSYSNKGYNKSGSGKKSDSKRFDSKNKNSFKGQNTNQKRVDAKPAQKKGFMSMLKGLFGKK